VHIRREYLYPADPRFLSLRQRGSGMAEYLARLVGGAHGGADTGG